MANVIKYNHNFIKYRKKYSINCTATVQTA